MKKLIVLSLMVGSLMFALPAVQAAAPKAVTAGQDIIIQPTRNRRGRWNNRRFAPTRVVTSTRTTWVNGVRYRETIRTTYFANGRTRTVIVNRVRLGGRRGFMRNY